MRVRLLDVARRELAFALAWDDWGGLRPRPGAVQGLRRPWLSRAAADNHLLKHDYVAHVQYETAGVVRFAEDLFGLGRLAAADKRALHPPATVLTCPKRLGHLKINAPKPAKFFMKKRFDNYFAPDYE